MPPRCSLVQIQDRDANPTRSAHSQHNCFERVATAAPAEQHNGKKASITPDSSKSRNPSAQLAALAVENQAELHSNDTDFSRFDGLRWRNPLK